MTATHFTKVLPVVAIAALAAACESPKAVLDLADKTAANVGTISVHLRQLEQNSRDIAERRAASSARLHAANARLRADYEYDVELVKQSGDSGNLASINQIDTWAKKVESIYQKADGAANARRKEILDTQTKLDSKTKKLAEIAQALATLAKEDKPEDRVRFLTGYATSLKGELDKALAADTETAKAAKALIDKAESKLKVGLDSAKDSLNSNAK